VSKILAIDDAAAILEHVQNVLRAAGHSVWTAQSAKAGLAILAQTDVDVILTDIYMPDEDGLDVIRRARQLRPTVPIIAMSSGTGHWDMLAIAKVMGARLSLVKPFTDRGLIEAVAYVCGS
jgi:CheY-like chemotaxis protein